MEQTNATTGEKKPINMRLVGLGSIGIGVMVLLGFLGYPIYQAKHGTQAVTINKKLIMLGLLGVILGLNMLIFGQRAVDILPSKDTDIKKIKPAYSVVIGISIAIGVALFMQIERYLTGLGYVDRY